MAGTSSFSNLIIKSGNIYIWIIKKDWKWIIIKSRKKENKFIWRKSLEILVYFYICDIKSMGEFSVA